MSVDGIWKVEMLGPYGWEPTATAYLENGKYKAGSRNHYAVGGYRVDGDRIKISARWEVHGQARTMFGKKSNEMDLEFKGDIEGKIIEGQVRERGGKHHVLFRATRLADVP